MGRAGHVTSVGDRRGAYRVLVERPGGKGPFVRTRRRWEKIKRMFKKWDTEVWTGFLWLRIETRGGACECGNEPSGSDKCWVFFE